MVRPLKIEYPGAVYHVNNRGNARQDTLYYAMGHPFERPIASECVCDL
jgi:hypothetical protein